MLRRSIDEEHGTLFSLSGYRGDRPLLGEMGKDTIGDPWAGLIVPPALVLFGTVLPKVGRLLGKNDRRFVMEHVQNTLAARIEKPESQFDRALRRG